MFEVFRFWVNLVVDVEVYLLVVGVGSGYKKSGEEFGVLLVFDGFGPADLQQIWDFFEEDDHGSDFLKGFGSGEVSDSECDFYINDMLIAFLDCEGNIRYLNYMDVIAFVEVLARFRRIISILIM